MFHDVIIISTDLLDHLAGSTTILMMLREKGVGYRENVLVLTNILPSAMEKMWENIESI